MRRLPEEMPAAYLPGDAGHEFRELITTRAWQARIPRTPERRSSRLQSTVSAGHAHSKQCVRRDCRCFGH